MILDVVRHGVTPSNLGHRFNDSEDEPLAPEAVAELAAITFDASEYDRLFVSHLRRAVETAERLGLPAWTLEPRLAERRLGVFQGLTEAQCRGRHGAAFEAFSRFDADFCIPAGESRGEHLARVQAWLEEVSLGDAGRVLAITHGGVIDFLYRLAEGRPIHGGPFDGGANLARSRFAIEWPAIRLIAFSERLS
jgi:broad specificity phosphatase PhoE